MNKKKPIIVGSCLFFFSLAATGCKRVTRVDVDGPSDDASTNIPRNYTLLTPEHLKNTLAKAFPEVDFSALSLESEPWRFFSTDTTRKLSTLSAHWTFVDTAATAIAKRAAALRWDEARFQAAARVLLRRSVSEDELSTLVPLLKQGETGWGKAIRSVLFSPRFLYRWHGVGPLGAEERAELLAMTLTGNPPDAELQAAATSGELATDKGFEKQIRRLWETQQAKNQFSMFVSEWLDIRPQNLQGKSADGVDYSGKILPAQWDEFRQFVSSSQNFNELFSRSQWKLNEDLNAFYGASRSDLSQPVDLSDQGRIGVLTSGLFSSAHFKTDNAPFAIHRSFLIQSRLLCQQIPPPPKDLNIPAAPPEADGKRTWRDSFTDLTARDVCQQCHTKLNPIAFLSQSFDGVGRRYLKSVPGGLPIDSKAEVTDPHQSPGSYQRLGDWSAAVASNATAAQCFAGWYLGFLTGRTRAETLEQIPKWAESAPADPRAPWADVLTWAYKAAAQNN